LYIPVKALLTSRLSNRWFHLRKQMGRALALQYRYSIGAKALKAWRVEAKYQVTCKTKVMGMLYKTDKQRRQDTWASWRDWIVLKRDGKLSKSRALGHLLNRLMGKAWNSWKQHHDWTAMARRVRID
jgi:hypothetical protein